MNSGISHHFDGQRYYANVRQHQSRQKRMAFYIGLSYCTYGLFVLFTNQTAVSNVGYYYSYVDQSTNVANKGINIRNSNDADDITTDGEDESNTSRYSSHIEMCQHLLPRLDYALSKHNAQMKAEALGIANIKGLNFTNIPDLHAHIPESFEMNYVLIEEDESICSSQQKPTKSLLRIFSSLLLSVASTSFHLNVEYRHNCFLWKNNRNNDGTQTIPLTIQEMLPEELISGTAVRDIPLDILAIRNICKGCMSQIHKSSDASKCVLFTKPASYKSSSQKEVTNTLSNGFTSIHPLMKEHVQNTIQLETNRLQENNSKILQYHPPIAKNETISSPEKILEPANSTLSSEESMTNNVVIYITCIDEDCDEINDAIALPFDYYRDKIPKLESDKEMLSISIIVSEACSNQINGCASYGQALFSFFVQNYIEAQVESVQESSTFSIYSRVIAADYLIYPPTNACILPAILSEGVSMIEIVDEDDIKYWPSYLFSNSKINISHSKKGKSTTIMDHKFLVGM